MVPKWKMEALAALSAEVKELLDKSNTADELLDEARIRAEEARQTWRTAEDLLDKLREHVEQTTPTAEGGGK